MDNIKELSKLAKTFTVLYVEDDKAIQNTMARYLQKFFSEVTVADQGLDGLKLYKKNSYDIVITDLSMPKMNGLDMLKQIRELDEEQAVLITSAHGETDYMVGAIKLGIDGYIIKPFDYHQLNYELNKIVTRLQKFRESALYKKNLEDMIDKKSAMISSLLDFQSQNYEQTLYSMVRMIEDRDTYTAGHSQRVATYSKMIAKDIGYSQEDCTKIYQAGMLHDIGKIATPDAVLLNPAHLNDIEYNLIKEHVRVGYQLLSHVPMFASLAEIVYSHHERFDALGYPRGIGGDEIIPLARIIIVADAFDAMTTSRIYKARKSVSEAIQELDELSGIQFHPEVIKVAKESLKDIVIDENINQLPKTELEEKRFAYFYKDTLTDLYNKSYLELLLARNTYEKKYHYLDIFFIKDFSVFNREHSWSSGDKLLVNFAQILKKHSTPESTIFRIYGDDFIVLSVNKDKYEIVEEKIKFLMQENNLEYKHRTINLEETKMTTLGDIENVIERV